MNIKRLMLAGLFLAFFNNISEAGTVRNRGGITKSGTYRKPHYKTSPNQSKGDNWSTKGNRNPYTGKKGTKKGY